MKFTPEKNCFRQRNRRRRKGSTDARHIESNFDRFEIAFKQTALPFANKAPRRLARIFLFLFFTLFYLFFIFTIRLLFPPPSRPVQ